MSDNASAANLSPATPPAANPPATSPAVNPPTATAAAGTNGTRKRGLKLIAVLVALADHAQAHAASLPTLVLWGKAAELLSALPANALFPRVVSEHPYNLSFIDHAGMQELFGPMQLLQRADATSLHMK